MLSRIYFNILDNNISNQGLNEFAKYISNIQNLEVLNLSSILYKYNL